jgi:hypothetical protein
MNDDQRFSILTFPQYFDGKTLDLNIVFMPRDQNPLAPAIIGHTNISEPVPAFADARLFFQAKIFDTTEVSHPHNFPSSEKPLMEVVQPTNSRTIFEAMAAIPELQITELTENSNTALKTHRNNNPKLKPSKARDTEFTVKKYLPHSYRKAFNFTRPRHKNLVTDQSYHCAIKEAEYVPGFERSSDVVSWGKVFAYLMRQPSLAEQAGLVYKAKLKIDPSNFPKGGWLYVDLADANNEHPKSDYFDAVSKVPAFVRRYAARIPALVPGEARQVFASVLFPVLEKANESGQDPVPDADYSSLYLEAAEYDDGFAKIIHCRQQQNRDRLKEFPDGSYPVKDAGIELGWDDEEIALRYIRQMERNTQGGMSDRIDAPPGIFGYAIDVRDKAYPEMKWQSLNKVEPRPETNRDNPTEPIEIGKHSGELPFQVYPVQLDGHQDKSYWLPMYFANWIGHSMVLPDSEAAAIYQTTNANIKKDPHAVVNGSAPDSVENHYGTGVMAGGAANQLNQIYQASDIGAELRYGKNYEFRVRLLDLSGGGPTDERMPFNETSSDTATHRFKRYLSPNQPRIKQMDAVGNTTIVNTDVPQAISQLIIQRPKLGYPAVVFTGKYTHPVERLIDQSNLAIQVDENDHNFNAEHRVGLGIADPDVDRIEVTVEIASLKLDKLNSISGKEDYVHLYTTTRRFPLINSNNDYEAELDIPIEYRDVKVLHTGGDVDLVGDLKLDETIDNLTEIVLPTGRTVRLTIRAVCEDKGKDGDGNAQYYGVIDADNKLLDNRFGEYFQVMVYAPSVDEAKLLVKKAGVPTIQGIYMQPDITTAVDGRLKTFLMGKKNSRQRDNVQLLATQLKVAASKLTLSAEKGERVVFGCSSRIRHTLAPDGSSLTFASKGDLINHWLCCISFELDRDWMWDALNNRSFVIRRTKRFSHDKQEVKDSVVAGDIEMVRTASFEALHNPQRHVSRIIFIDAVEPKKVDPSNPTLPNELEYAATNPEFPDTIELEYTLEVGFKSDHAERRDPEEVLELKLPITTPPAQVPRIVSAGIALSPYIHNEKYSASEIRKRYLWIEFEEPLRDKQDAVFARVLATAPDQLLSNNNLELLRAPEEPDLPIDPEYIRVVTAGATNDLAGLKAMQRMEMSTTSECHYILPLPPGLHAEADEMFGFFTYEFRIGHYRAPGSGDMVWTTAQGRYGRPLRATGLQHPAPTLTCMPNRDRKKMWVTAPYAVAVHDGKNVTADPPRTELWGLLYAQVRQADNQDFRNILLDDRQLDWQVQVKTEKDIDILEKYSDVQLKELRSIAFKNFKYELNAASAIETIKLIDYSTINKDATKYGTVVWNQNEILQILRKLGLPLNLPLSVLVVETLPQITNVVEHISQLGKPRVAATTAGFLASIGNGHLGEYYQMLVDRVKRSDASHSSESRPLSDDLGHHRILRTSPLTEVPEICPPK